MYMHEVQVNHLAGLSLSRKSVLRLIDRPDMAIAVYRGCKTITQQQQQQYILSTAIAYFCVIADNDNNERIGYESEKLLYCPDFLIFRMK